MNVKMWFMSGLLIMLVLASGIVTAQGSGFDTTDEPTDRGFISVKTIGQTDSATELEIGVITVGELQDIEGNSITTEEYNAIADSCSGSENYDVCIAEKLVALGGGTEHLKITPESVEGAVFKVEYFDSLTKSYRTVPGCEEVVADNTRVIEDYYETEELQYYYGTCTVPKSGIYDGKTVNVQVALLSPLGIEASDVINEVKDTLGPSPAGAFSVALNELISSMVSSDGSSITSGGTTLPCIGIFILLGLLLASMYFTGKSPITLLDITTPRMPAPKGVAAGGQVMLPYGYGEMKKSLGRKMGTAAGAVGATAAAVRARGGYDPEAEKMKKMISSGASGNEKKIKEGIMSLSRKAGYKSSDIENLLRKSTGEYGDKEHKLMSQLFTTADKMGGKTALMGQSMKDYLLSVRTMQTMDALSGHPSATTQSALHKKLVGTMGKYVGGGRYAGGTGIPTMTIGSTESTIRSTRVAFRGAKAIAEHAPDAARAVARTTMTMVGGERAMEKMERSRPKTAAWLKKPSKQVEIGQMFPVGEKMNQLYGTLKEEVVNDEMKFAMKQLYKKMGVNFAITEEELVQMGYKDMNILEASGYNKNKTKIGQMEPEMLAILMSKELSSVEKRDKLMALAVEHGAISNKVLSEMTQFNERLDSIEASGQPGYNKFLQLQEMIVQHEQHTAAAAVGQVMADDHFYTVIGRKSIAGSDLWETMVLRNLIHDADEGHLNGGGLKEELQIGWLKTLNRMTSLKPTSNMEELPSYMRNKSELQAIEKRVESTIKDLLTDEGKANLTTFSGKSVANADIHALETVLYGGRSKAPTNKTGVVDEEGRVAWWGDDKELGPLAGNFKGDMKELWLTELKTNESLALGMWTEGRFKRSYIDAYDATVEANLDRMAGSSKWSVEERTEMAKKEWTKKLMGEDMENRFNSVYSLNAYGKGPESAAFYAGVTAGFLEKALIDKGLPTNHPDLVNAQTLDVSNPNQLKKLQGLLTKHKVAFEEVMTRPVTYDDIVNSKQAMVMLYEGGFAFAHKGMPLSSSDRIYGSITIKDQNGRKKEFEPADVAIDFPGREDLRQGFYKMRETKDPKECSAFMESVTKWAKEGGYNAEREKVFAAVVWEYGQNTNDLQRYYSRTSLEITPKREATPVAPEALRMFGIEGERVREAMKPWRNMMEDVGTYVGKVALVAGGPVFRHSYDITPVTEVARQHSWKLAANIYTKDYNDLSAAEKRAYEKLGASHFEFHHAWQWAVDRNPMRNSSSHGLQGSTESYFHFGPRETYASENYLRGTMTKSQWQGWKYGPWGAFADVATKIHSIPAGMFGGMQMSMQGYPGKFDQTGNPLKPWDYTGDTRLLEAGRSLNPFTSALGNVASKLNIWEGSLERRQLAGADIKEGLAAGPQDTMFKKTGIFANARLGDANPGASALSYRFEHQLDPAMAEWLVRNKEAAYMHDQDIQKQAYSNTTRRTVAAEALGIRREQELRQFGMMQNSIYGFFNPLLFAWHLPIAPPSWSPKEIIQRQARNAKHGGGRKWTATVDDMFTSTKDNVARAAQPWKGHMVSYCRKCGTPGYKGSSCMKCRGTIYGA